LLPLAYSLSEVSDRCSDSFDTVSFAQGGWIVVVTMSDSLFLPCVTAQTSHSGGDWHAEQNLTVVHMSHHQYCKLVSIPSPSRPAHEFHKSPVNGKESF